MKRKTVVAGYFYPSEKRELLKFMPEKKKDLLNVIGAILPHAGYIYSGWVQKEVYSRIKIPENVVILGVNHNGIGDDVALSESESWETPFGDIEINKEISNRLCEISNIFSYSETAHAREHSIEVQLPFIKYLNKNSKIVPISILNYNIKILKEIGNALSEIKKDFPEILVIASSDFSHYEPQKITEKKDKLAIEKILNIDPEGLYEVVFKNNISMCGIATVTSLLFFLKNEGIKKGELIKYQTSGDISGDYSSVVGYAGIVFY